MRSFLLSVLLATAAPALFAQAPAEEARRPAAAIEALLQQRPEDATLWFLLARAQVRSGELAAAIRSMENVAKFGDGFLPRREDFGPLWDHAEFRELRSRMEAKLPRLDYAPIAFALDDRGLIPEGIAFDAPSHSFFLGSIVQHKIVRVDEEGAITDFAGISGDLDAVLGIAVDSPRRILYAVSTSALTAAGEAKRRNAIVAYDVDNRRLLNRYEVPGAKQLNDVTVARGGRVFTTDSGSGAVYEIPVKGPGPARELVPPGTLRGSNGLAASPNASRLYVAHATGIAVVDLASGAVKRVENRTRETVAAIDGLYEWQGELIGVQNLTTPGRVIRIALTPQGDAITGVRTVLSHHHAALDEPTTAAITPRGLFVLAATGIAHYNRQGLVDHPETVPRPTVLRVPL